MLLVTHNGDERRIKPADIETLQHYSSPTLKPPEIAQHLRQASA